MPLQLKKRVAHNVYETPKTCTISANQTLRNVVNIHQNKNKYTYSPTLHDLDQK